MLRKLHLNGKGYRRVSLRGPDHHGIFSVHSLVLTAFVSTRPAGYHANHRDFNILHNCLTNLEWVHPSQNKRRYPRKCLPIPST